MACVNVPGLAFGFRGVYGVSDSILALSEPQIGAIYQILYLASGTSLVVRVLLKALLVGSKFKLQFS